MPKFEITKPNTLRSILKKIHRLFLLLSKKLSRKNISRFLGAEFLSIPRGAIVGNIGAGGDIERHLKIYAERLGYSVTSLDIDPERNPDILCDITSPNLGKNYFDVIVMAEVLEHVTDPHAAVRGIKQLLKPGGTLILTVPFIFPIHDRPNDYFRYTRYGLMHLFQEMDDLNIKERNSWSEAIGVLIARLIMEKTLSARLVSPLAVLFAISFMPFAIIIAKVIQTDFITTGYFLTCRKRADKDFL
jgi:SAM-dependent methyltransferase